MRAASSKHSLLVSRHGCLHVYMSEAKYLGDSGAKGALPISHISSLLDDIS